MADLKESSCSLLSATTVSLESDATTTLYTVPAGKTCILSHAIVVLGLTDAADAGATTTMSIGTSASPSVDFCATNTLTNLDAVGDCVILKPIPNTTPLKSKIYAAGAVIAATVASQSGTGTSELSKVYLYGTLY